MDTVNFRNAPPEPFQPCNHPTGLFYLSSFFSLCSMSARILNAFEKAKAEGRPVFVPFMTAGFPTQQATVPFLLALQKGGADLIELGVPHTDPLADGPVIQQASSGTDICLLCRLWSDTLLLPLYAKWRWRVG